MDDHHFGYFTTLRKKNIAWLGCTIMNTRRTLRQIMLSRTRHQSAIPDHSGFHLATGGRKFLPEIRPGMSGKI